MSEFQVSVAVLLIQEGYIHYLIVMNSVAHCSWSGLEVTLFVRSYLSKHPREICRMCSVSSVLQCFRFDWWIGISYENGWRRRHNVCTTHLIILWTFCRLFYVPQISFGFFLLANWNEAFVAGLSVLTLWVEVRHSHPCDFHTTFTHLFLSLTSSISPS